MALYRARAGQVGADLVAIVGVAVLLVGLHVLVPFGFRDTFALWYATPDPLAALTAAYVHADAAHLVGNVTGYLAGATVAYALSLFSGERRWFHLTWLSCLLVLPIGVGLTAAAIVDRPVVGRGFSGVVAGFAGVVLVGGGVVLHRAFGVDRRTMWEVVAMLAVVVAAEILWLATDANATVLAGLVAVGVGLPLVSMLGRGATSARPAGRDAWRHAVGAVVVTTAVLGVLTWFVVGLFPAQIVGDSGVTNILAHYLGLVFGGGIAAWGYRYWSAGPENRRS